MKIEIKNRFSLEVLFSHECEDNSVAITLAAAINAKTNLYGADLGDANLYGADLYGADLRSADLRSADLGDANLYGANLRAGCFFGTVEAFRDKLQGEHGDNAHAIEYRAALVLVEAHYAAWPATVVEGEAPAES